MNESKVRKSDICMHLSHSLDGSPHLCKGRLMAQTGEEFTDVESNSFFKVVGKCMECARTYVFIRKDNRKTDGR